MWLLWMGSRSKADSAGKGEITVLVKWGYCGIQDAPYTQLAIKLFRSSSSASPLEQTILFAFLVTLIKGK